MHTYNIRNVRKKRPEYYLAPKQKQSVEWQINGHFSFLNSWYSRRFQFVFADETTFSQQADIFVGIEMTCKDAIVNKLRLTGLQKALALLEAASFCSQKYVKSMTSNIQYTQYTNLRIQTH